MKNSRKKDPTYAEYMTEEAKNTYVVPEKNSQADKYKTKLCKWYEKGHCKFGNHCTLAHGTYEQRIRGDPVSLYIIQKFQKDKKNKNDSRSHLSQSGKFTISMIVAI